MILDRLVIAGLTWTGRALFAPRSRAKVAPPRTAEPSATVRETEPDYGPVETQEVVGPDQDLIQSFNVEESMGFGDMR